MLGGDPAGVAEEAPAAPLGKRSHLRKSTAVSKQHIKSVTSTRNENQLGQRQPINKTVNGSFPFTVFLYYKVKKPAHLPNIIIDNKSHSTQIGEIQEYSPENKRNTQSLSTENSCLKDHFVGKINNTTSIYAKSTLYLPSDSSTISS
ncbi:hypothetical protein FZC75_15700 [Sutcliffiella horikoshii]|uniref:Uncharacterized protein n=1 Tax=Sutcliffiella horikoshii TaxID=79883 RepID=A0A5D4T464_9BACI|nr:hypothetical protein FZC75_15700 [Sutcliffiella horikoshii]